MAESRWYDKFAPLYDIGTVGDFFYRQPRKVAIDQLELSEGSTVLDIFCGTGVDLPFLSAGVGETGAVLAVDGSEGMLQKAKDRSKRISDNDRIEFLQADFSKHAGLEALRNAVDRMRPRHVLFSLGLTCLENWREFCSLVFNACPSGTQFSIMDVYSNRLTPGARFINWIGAADCRRPVWQVLEERGESFVWQAFRPFKILDVSVFVASARKP